MAKSRKEFILTLIGILFLLQPSHSIAQVKKGLGIDGGMYFNSNEELLFSTSVTYNWLINKNLILSTGGMLVHSKLDKSWGVYSLDENVLRLNSVSSATYICPIYKQTGIYGSGSFIFEPIPFDYISIDKQTESKNVSKGKYIFSRFTPGAFLETGIFHSFNKNNKALKLFCGIGYGWYDPFADYRSCTLDGQNLSSHIPQDKNYYRISVRLLGL
jgi:hypothetical protein